MLNWPEIASTRFLLDIAAVFAWKAASRSISSLFLALYLLSLVEAEGLLFRFFSAFGAMAASSSV